jgi:peroxiredoxin
VTNVVSENKVPNLRKLFEGIAYARKRITSGEMEFEVFRYDLDLPLQGTNRIRIKALFDGNRYRFESFGREYRFTVVGTEAGEAVRARIQAEGLDNDAAVRAGLLQPFESHHVTAYDGTLLLDYWETDGRPERAKIDLPVNGGTTAFDPRCLGIEASPITQDTLEGCLPYTDGRTIQFVGEEFVKGSSTWHVRIRRGWADADFWLETANPVHVLRYTFNGSEVVSYYDDSNPKDPLPVEVVEMFLHGTTGTQTAFSSTRIIRRNARFNISIDPASWTLAGLGMKIGTDVVDYRIHRSIGYWTGSGLSENLPSKTNKAQSPPDGIAMLDLLVNWPDSPEAAQAAQWVLLNTPDGPDVEKAADVLFQSHIRDTNLVFLAQELERLRHRCSRRLLEAMLQKNPSSAVRGNACLALATMRKADAKYGQNQQAASDARQLFERVISEFGRVQRNSTSLADLAKPELLELQRLTLGKPAPQIEGQDLDGQPLRFSDYRGQVVLLVFWCNCGGCVPDMTPLVKLLGRFSGKPFAILGVYCDDDGPSKANSLAQELGMTWPSFNDGRTGPISTAWNNHSWPSFQLIDANGRIRSRNIEERRLEQALADVMKN